MAMDTDANQTHIRFIAMDNKNLIAVGVITEIIINKKEDWSIKFNNFFLLTKSSYNINICKNMAIFSKNIKVN